ncbi:rCG50795 [Rattus norvegicus]|uniref:RCG50795 n=1 Tax=Rattus norvegicus TaxID=10116 RepID=A6KC09_RAT|nr:rCG50795 [Rattus norvegicus]
MQAMGSSSIQELGKGKNVCLANSFLRNPRITYPGAAPSTMGRALPYQSSIEKTSHRLAYMPTWQEAFSQLGFPLSK